MGNSPLLSRRLFPRYRCSLVVGYAFVRWNADYTDSVTKFEQARAVDISVSGLRLETGMAIGTGTLGKLEKGMLKALLLINPGIAEPPIRTFARVAWAEDGLGGFVFIDTGTVELARLKLLTGRLGPDALLH